MLIALFFFKVYFNKMKGKETCKRVRLFIENEIPQKSITKYKKKFILPILNW